MERRGNARHSKMSKIHTLGLSVFSTHEPSRAERRGEGKNSFQYKWMTSRECVSLYQLFNISLFFFLPLSPHGNIQQKPRDEFSAGVRMSVFIFLSPPLLSPSPLPPWSPSLFHSKTPFCVFSVRNQTLRNISGRLRTRTPATSGGVCVSVGSGGGGLY